MTEGTWTAEVEWTSGYLFVGADASGHSAVYDTSEAPSRGMSPMDALLTSLGACTGMDIVAILKKRKQALRSLKVYLSGERPEHGLPKPWTGIHIKYVLSGESLDTKYVEEAIKDSTEKFCSVGATIQPTAKIIHSYEIVP